MRASLGLAASDTLGLCSHDTKASWWLILGLHLCTCGVVQYAHGWSRLSVCVHVGKKVWLLECRSAAASLEWGTGLFQLLRRSVPNGMFSSPFFFFNPRETQ